MSEVTLRTGKVLAYAVIDEGGLGAVRTTRTHVVAEAYAEESGHNRVIVPLVAAPVLTDAELGDLEYWLAECLRQCSVATEGCNHDIAERWNDRAARAAAMLNRLGGGK